LAGAGAGQARAEPLEFGLDVTASGRGVKIPRLPRDSWLLCFSAFSADLGYQGITALFPLYLVFDLHASLYAYGVVTALAFGGGAFVAFAGGRLGDRAGHRRIAIIGNALIPLMALAGLAGTIWLAALLYILGWWARYSRSPSRRALLVNVTPPEQRVEAFGMLHALDIGGGMISALLALGALWWHVALGTIMLWAAVPLIVSTLLLIFVRLDRLYTAVTPLAADSAAARASARALMVPLLVSATLYGFSFYNLGFPILTAAGAHRSAGYEWGVLAYVVYLGVSACSGYLLALYRGAAPRALWLIGYLVSALGSGLIGLGEWLHLPDLSFYLAVAVLGFGMGAVETFEPTLVSSAVHHTRLGRGMGFLSVSRASGQLLANLAMGLLFVFGQAVPYFYAAAAALLAAIIFGFADLSGRGRRSA
jgi:MFS family permease